MYQNVKMVILNHWVRSARSCSSGFLAFLYSSSYQVLGDWCLYLDICCIHFRRSPLLRFCYRYIDHFITGFRTTSLIQTFTSYPRFSYQIYRLLPFNLLTLEVNRTSGTLIMILFLLIKLLKYRSVLKLSLDCKVQPPLDVQASM